MQLMYYVIMYGLKQSRAKMALRPGACFLLTGLLLATSVYAQISSKKVTLSLHNAGIEVAFKEIQLQTGYVFVYTTEQVRHAKTVSLQLNSVPLMKALDACFTGQPISYVVEGNHIVIKERAVPVTALRQTTAFAGIVKNEKGEPLVGATVEVLQKNLFSTTHADGSFTLPGVEASDLIKISYIGYLTKVIRPGKDIADIMLAPAVIALDETLIIAYGTTTRRLSTGTVSKVAAGQIEKQPVSNPLAALQGRVPGLFITQQSGVPGGSFSVLIRGKNSIQSGTSPLYVVDGVPFLSDGDALAQRATGIDGNHPFNTINPLDIESVEVLKDADATAIYGSRGANGVILITTKKAKGGKTALSANVQHGWGRVTRSPRFLNTAQYVSMRKEAFKNDGVTPTVTNAYDLLLWDTTRYTDWKKVLIGGTSSVLNANLRYSGGNTYTGFTISSQYYRETTVYPTDAALQRYNFSSDLRHRSPNSRLQTSFTTTYSQQRSALPRTDLTTIMSNLAPNAPHLYDSLGRLNWSERGARFANPLSHTLQEQIGVTSRLTSNATIAVELTPSLALKTSLGYNSLSFDETSLRPVASQDPAANPRGTAAFGTNRIATWIIEPQLDYKRDVFKKGALHMVTGSTWQATQNTTSLIEGTGYSDDRLLRSTTGAQTLTASNGFSQYRYTALYGRLSTRWDSKYLLSLTGRRDGSSRFGPDKRFSNFGAIGWGWIFTNEGFLKNSKSFLSFGKIRGSYGVTGNDQIGDYKYLDVFGAAQFPYGGIPALKPVQLFNADYSWERNRKLEAAVELGLFADRLMTTINWFRNRSDNQLIFYNLPAQTGFTGIVQNFPGEVQNRGWELELNGSILRKTRFAWNASFNVTIARNTLVSFPGLETSSYVSSYAVGQPLSVLFGHVYKGLDPQTGLYTFEDLDRDGVIRAQSGSNFNDFTVIGTTDPSYYGGLRQDLTFKGMSLDFLFQFVGQQRRHPIYSNSTLVGALNVNHPDLVLGNWKVRGDVYPYQQFSQKTTSNPVLNAARQMAVSDASLTDASFIRLKNIAFSYGVPEKVLPKRIVSGVRLYLQAQNLLTFTSFPGVDPESGSRQSLPPLKMIAAGIEVKL